MGAVEIPDLAARQLRADVAQLTRELDELRVKISAPPIVPEGWRVDRWDVLDEETGDPAEPRVLGPWDWGQIDTGFERSYRPQPTPAVLRALAWAIEHDTRPPHAGDE